MNEPNDQLCDELRDRLLDQALRETLGAESPPDLSDRILAAADEQTAVLPQPKGEGVMGKAKRRRWMWAAVASATCLLIVASIVLLLPAVHADREAARRNTVSSNLRQYGLAEATEQSQLQFLVDSSRSMNGAGAGYFDYVEGPVASPAPPIVSNPWPNGQGTDEPFRQPLMQGAGVQYNRIAGPGTIPSRPGYAAQQNQSRTVALSQDGNVLARIQVEVPVQTLPSPQHTSDEVRLQALIEETQTLSDRRNHLAAERTKSNDEARETARRVNAAKQSLSELRKEVEMLRADPSSSGDSQDAAVSSLTTKTEELNRLGEKLAFLEAQTRAIHHLTATTDKKLADAMEVLRKFTLDSGQGPGEGGDQYVRLVENPFQAVKDHPLSTFSIDVDTASYANVRRFLLQENQLPPPDAVRIEELVNYFDYDYSPPTSDVPFASHIEVAECPWTPEHRLVRIALKGREIQTNQRPASNLVFLLDVSGSMDQPDKLPLLQAGMKLLAGQLSENDRVAIVVYAGSEGLVLPSTVGDQRAKILDSIDRLKVGGSTNGGAGIELAYKVARENFIKEGVNRVILCTDGDFNVGTTSTGALERMVEEKAKSGVFLSVLGFGRGNLNDAMMETISNKGNGNYAYIDGITEAQKVLVEQMGGTLITIAKDVKIQVEFNPTQAEAYRLIGYENRVLAAEDFNDDKKDAGEIGAGHTVTTLYEVVPAGGKVDLPGVDPLKYQTEPKKTRNKEVAGELLTLKLRYKQPDGDKSDLLEFPVTDGGGSFSKASPNFQFAAAVASFGMLLRGSQYQGMSSYDAVLEIAQSAKGADKHGYRAEFAKIVERAKPLGEERAALIEEARKVLETAEQSVEHDQ